jgi:molybdopterin-guanine dinucleotide biosynthesis protein A
MDDRIQGVARGGTVGVILAGGQATRMGGGDKCLLEIGGRRLLDIILDRLRPQVDAVILNANGDPARFAAWDLPVVADSVGGFAGPLAGVLAGMDRAAGMGAAGVVTVAGDTPFFPTFLAAALKSAAYTARQPLAMAMTPDPARGLARHPTFGFWPVALRDDLRVALAAGTRKVVAWTEPQGCAQAIFDLDGGDPFFNVNTPDDQARARDMAA